MNATGQAGNGSNNNALISTAGQVGLLTAVSGVAAGGTQVVAVQPGGAAWSWGGNNWGEAGINGNTSYYLSPQAMTRINNVVAVGAGTYFGLAVKNDGSVWSWGANDEGQLGNNSSTNSSVPVAVLGLGGQGKLNLGSTSSTLIGADCLFNWAESNYASLFDPLGTPSATLSPYYYRPYVYTSAYLGVSTNDGRVYYLGPASRNAILDLGPLSTWLVTSGCR